MIIKPPPKYPAKCSLCQYADISKGHSQAYCTKKGIFKRIKLTSCKLFEPKGSATARKLSSKPPKDDYRLTNEERLEVIRRNFKNGKLSPKLRARYKKRLKQTE